jgi:hypothetical protein
MHKGPRVHKDTRKRSPAGPELGPFHPSVAELAPSVPAPEVKPLDTGNVFTEISPASSSTDGGPRPVIVGLALVLVLMAGVLLVVFFQY